MAGTPKFDQQAAMLQEAIAQQGSQAGAEFGTQASINDASQAMAASEISDINASGVTHGSAAHGAEMGGYQQALTNLYQNEVGQAQNVFNMDQARLGQANQFYFQQAREGAAAASRRGQRGAALERERMALQRLEMNMRREEIEAQRRREEERANRGSMLRYNEAGARLGWDSDYTHGITQAGKVTLEDGSTATPYQFIYDNVLESLDNMDDPSWNEVQQLVGMFTDEWQTTHGISHDYPQTMALIQQQLAPFFNSTDPIAHNPQPASAPSSWLDGSNILGLAAAYDTGGGAAVANPAAAATAQVPPSVPPEVAALARDPYTTGASVPTVPEQGRGWAGPYNIAQQTAAHARATVDRPAFPPSVPPEVAALARDPYATGASDPTVPEQGRGWAGPYNIAQQTAAHARATVDRPAFPPSVPPEVAALARDPWPEVSHWAAAEVPENLAAAEAQRAAAEQIMQEELGAAGRVVDRAREATPDWVGQSQLAAAVPDETAALEAMALEQATQPTLDLSEATRILEFVLGADAAPVATTLAAQLPPGEGVSLMDLAEISGVPLEDLLSPYLLSSR